MFGYLDLCVFVLVIALVWGCRVIESLHKCCLCFLASVVPCVDISMDVLFLYLVGIYMNYDFFFFFFFGLEEI